MSQDLRPAQEWCFLIGYSWEEAEQLLTEKAMSFQLQLTAPPGKTSSPEDSYVIAVRAGEPLVVICASPDWDVN